jgi:hypothetical protein
VRLCPNIDVAASTMAAILLSLTWNVSSANSFARMNSFGLRLLRKEGKNRGDAQATSGPAKHISHGFYENQGRIDQSLWTDPPG